MADGPASGPEDQPKSASSSQEGSVDQAEACSEADATRAESEGANSPSMEEESSTTENQEAEIPDTVPHDEACLHLSFPGGVTAPEVYPEDLDLDWEESPSPKLTSSEK